MSIDNIGQLKAAIAALADTLPITIRCEWNGPHPNGSCFALGAVVRDSRHLNSLPFVALQCEEKVLCWNCGCPATMMLDYGEEQGVWDDGEVEGVCSIECYAEILEQGCPVEFPKRSYRECPHPPLVPRVPSPQQAQ